jgi:hypothetical protein
MSDRPLSPSEPEPPEPSEDLDLVQFLRIHASPLSDPDPVLENQIMAAIEDLNTLSWASAPELASVSNPELVQMVLPDLSEVELSLITDSALITDELGVEDYTLVNYLRQHAASAPSPAPETEETLMRSVQTIVIPQQSPVRASSSKRFQRWRRPAFLGVTMTVLTLLTVQVWRQLLGPSVLTPWELAELESFMIGNWSRLSTQEEATLHWEVLDSQVSSQAASPQSDQSQSVQSQSVQSQLVRVQVSTVQPLVLASQTSFTQERY